MAFFSQKKKEQNPETLPPLKFPELPSITPGELPSYEQTSMKEAAEIKRAVMPREEPRQLPVMARPAFQESVQDVQVKQEQPLFIKVDAYREVTDTLSTIKAKLADASQILEELTRLKEEEDKELSEWHSDLSAIKEKLMLVDQKLFEQ